MKFHFLLLACICCFSLALSAQADHVEKKDTLQWQKFSASLLQKDVYLQWQNPEEQNAAFFVIEKSIDGINFTEVGRMQAGNNTNAKVYSLTDAAPQKGAYFYRVKAVDENHHFFYSPVKKVIAGERQALLQLLQNPVTGSHLQVMIHGQQEVAYIIRIYNAQAKMLLQKPAASGNNSIDLSSFSAGLYLAELLQNDQPTGERLWVVKQ